MQAKDIPDDEILKLIPKGRWIDRWKIAEILQLPDKLVLAKLRKLVKRGLVSGCACGCRGDFELP